VLTKELGSVCAQCFVLSPDPHQTHHLALELELIPSWTFLAAQRFTSPSSSTSSASPSSAGAGGPTRKADELSETELGWIERGLEVASLYHPVAERRLVELRAYRVAERARVEQLVGAGATCASSSPAALSDPRARRADAALPLAAFPFPASMPMPSTPRPSLKHAGSSHGFRRKLDFQEAMREALAQTVPSWA